MSVKFRYIYIVVLVSVLLAGCSHESTEPEGGEEPAPETGTPIVFRGMVTEDTPVTRATDLEEITETFKVWCYKNLYYDNVNGTFGNTQTVMNGFTVNWQDYTAGSTPTNTSNWEYVGQGNDQTIKFWDWSATAYRFFALANLDGANVDGANVANVTGVTVTFTADADDADVKEKCPYYSRLWFSDGNLSHYPDRLFGQPVELVFLRPFAKVRYLFISGDPDMNVDEMNLQDMKFGPLNAEQKIATKGTFTVTYPLTGSGIMETWQVSDISTTLNSFSSDEQWFTVLPVTGQGAFQLEVEVNGVPKECIVPAEFMDWQPSYQYTYIFKVSEEGGVELGQVYSAYTDWITGREGTHIVYNW